MKISVIVPIHNAAATLEKCLTALLQYLPDNCEIIVVDDHSLDQSFNIAGKFPVRLIRLDKNAGAGNARNIGAEKSTGELLVFVDSDVIINDSTFSLILGSFKKDPELDAIIGYFSIDNPYNNFFSQYKNLYMNFVFLRMPDYVDFLFSSLYAVRRRSYLGFAKIKLKADDTELGQRCREKGERILFHRGLKVIHLKKYSFLSFIRNDFIIPRDWAIIFLRHKGFWQVISQKRFAHARLNQIIGICISPLVILFFWGGSIWHPAVSVALFLLATFLLLHRDFLIFLYKKRGLSFLFTAIVITYLDSLIMGVGILVGVFSYCFMRKG